MNRCISCGSEFFQKPLIECDNMPKSAQHFPTIPNSDDSPITLKLVQCSGCGLVQLDVDPVSYYRDVIRSGGYSSTMHNLRNQQYKRFLEKCPMTNKRHHYILLPSLSKATSAVSSDRTATSAYVSRPASGRTSPLVIAL